MAYKFEGIAQQQPSSPEQRGRRPFVREDRERYALERPVDYLFSGASRGAEAVLGAPGDLASLGFGIASAIPGSPIPSYEQIQEKLPISLPTSGQVRGKIAEVTKGRFEPRSTGEEIFGNVAGDIARFFAPVGAFGKLSSTGLLKKIAKFGATSLGGELSAKGVETLGGGPIAQAIAKGVFMTGAMGFGTKKELKNKMTDAFDRGKEIAKGKNVRLTPSFSKRINEMYDQIKKGDLPEKNFLLDRIDALKNNIKGGRANVNDLWDLKRDFNKHIKNLGDKSPPLMKKIVGMAKTPLKKFAAENSAFGKAYNTAEDIATGLHTASKATQTLTKGLDKLGKSIKNPLVKYGLLSYPGLAIKGIAGYGILGGSRMVTQFMDFVRNSKEARKAYNSLFKNAAAQNLPGVLRTATRLDKLADHYYQDYEEEPYGGRYLFEGIGE